MTADFFAENRRALQAKLGGVIVLAGHGNMQRTNDVAYPFEQEANFWYLTGIAEPDWWMIMAGSKSWLVRPQLSHVRETFDGSLSPEDAARMSGIKAVITIDDADELLRDLARKHSLVYTLGKDPHASMYDFQLNASGAAMRKRLERLFGQVDDCRKELARARAIKQPQEIAAIKKAVAVTMDAFTKAKAQLASYKYEYELVADFSHHFLARGSNHAYDPIVASGANACTLHYVKNNAKLRKSSLVLMDIGACYEGYAADITRTYAMGDVSSRKRAVHTAVEQAHHQIINLLKPGYSLEAYVQDVDTIMKRALISLRLLSNEADPRYRTYFPHAISHGLGIDVHDSLGGFKTFQPGMVLTVEPGIYIPEEGIGVRIEDDIVITEQGRLNLSAKLPTAL